MIFLYPYRLLYPCTCWSFCARILLALLAKKRDDSEFAFSANNLWPDFSNYLSDSGFTSAEDSLALNDGHVSTSQDYSEQECMDGWTEPCTLPSTFLPGRSESTSMVEGAEASDTNMAVDVCYGMVCNTQPTF